MSVIDNTFATSPTDPLFRPNDTANNPSTTTYTADDYSIFLNLGAARIGKTLPSASIANFMVAAADANTDARFAAPDHFPLTTDPQHPGVKTLSLFRRPLVNTNVHLDSAVLWDGRDSITTIATSQVPKAIQSLLTTSNGGNCAGCPGTDPAVNQDIANFMLGVFTEAHAPRRFWPVLNNGDLAAVYCFVFLYLAVAGGGPWSLDRLWQQKWRSTPPIQGR